MRSGGKVKVPHDLVSFLKTEDNFLIATHINPDGDAIGSALGLALALESTGKKVTVYDRDPVPEFYRFLPGQNKFIHSLHGLDTSSFNLILVDCNSPDRVGFEEMDFRHSCVIDHHETEKNFGLIKWVAPDAAATGLLIFYLLRESGFEVTQDIAVNLYTAIVIDTGAFRYANTTAEVLKVGAWLIEAGANPALISNSLYEMWTDRRFALLIMVLNTLEIRDDVALTFVTRRMFNKTNTGPEDTENFANFPRMIRDVKISAFLRQMDRNHWKISLRSKGDVNVAGIASLFEGGGHKNAAGCKIKGNLKTSKETLLKAISQLNLS
jgi:bifunctional oligoribonuclease and PAP phosphatase NrnA